MGNTKHQDIKTKTQQEHERIKDCIEGVRADFDSGIISESTGEYLKEELYEYIRGVKTLHDLEETFSVPF